MSTHVHTCPPIRREYSPFRSLLPLLHSTSVKLLGPARHFGFPVRIPITFRIFTETPRHRGPAQKIGGTAPSPNRSNQTQKSMTFLPPSRSKKTSIYDLPTGKRCFVKIPRTFRISVERPRNTPEHRFVFLLNHIT